jgi:hypothetical protein
MTPRLTRRAALVLPFVLASCGDDEPPPTVRGNFPPLRYGYLPPINLNVQRIEMSTDFIPPSGDAEVSGLSPVNLAETLLAMARDRLKPVANGGVATFRIETASITRRRDALNGTLAIRLDVHDAEDTNSGFAEARVTRTKTGSIADLRGTIYDMVKSMMDDMNVEMEYQLRNKLRAWVVGPPAASPRVNPPAGNPPPTNPPLGNPPENLPLPPPPPPRT